MPLPLVQPPAQELTAEPVLIASRTPGSQKSANGKFANRKSASRRFDAPAPLAFWHLASFDAPTVAVVWSLAFAWAAKVQLALWTPVLLALVAWSVYIGDRLLDARSGLRSPELHELRERHFFHWRHRYVLLPLAACSALAAAGIVLEYMPLRARVPNSMLGVAALAYFSGVHSRRRLPRVFTKEFLVGAIFTAGCALPAWLRLRASGVHAWPLLAPAVYFAALAWLNCHAIGRWEAGNARPLAAGVQPLGVALALAGFTLACAAPEADARAAALLIAGAASALLLAVLDRVRGRLSPLALRALADLVLLTPLLLAPLQRFPA